MITSQEKNVSNKLLLIIVIDAFLVYGVWHFVLQSNVVNIVSNSILVCPLKRNISVSIYSGAPFGGVSRLLHILYIYIYIYIIENNKFNIFFIKKISNKMSMYYFFF